MQPKRKKRQTPEGSEASAPEQKGNDGSGHVGSASGIGGALGYANPRVSTNIRIGGGEISDQPTPDQLLTELTNVIDHAAAGTTASAFRDQVAALSRWFQQDRTQKRSGAEDETLAQLDVHLKVLKACLESSAAQPELNEVLQRLLLLHGVLSREMTSRMNIPKRGPQEPDSIKGESDPAVLDGAMTLIDQLPPSGTTRNYGERDARLRFEEALKPLLDRLEELGERYIPEARVPSPCGTSRLGYALCRPWINLLGCHDLCGTCREQARRALRLVREGVVDGKPSEKFIAPEIAAALINRASRADEILHQQTVRSMERLRQGARLIGSRTLGTSASTRAASEPVVPSLPTPAAAKLPPSGDPPDLEIRHADDFSSLHARGITYHFATRLQRAVIRALFAEWQRVGRKDGCGLTVLALAGRLEDAGEGPRLRLRMTRLFKGDPVLGTILRKSGRSTWALYLTGPEIAPR